MKEATTVLAAEFRCEEFYHPLARKIVDACYELGWKVSEVWADNAYWAYDSMEMSSIPVQLCVEVEVNGKIVVVNGPWVTNYRQEEKEELILTRQMVEAIAYVAADLLLEDYQ